MSDFLPDIILSLRFLIICYKTVKNNPLAKSIKIHLPSDIFIKGKAYFPHLHLNLHDYFELLFVKGDS